MVHFTAVLLGVLLSYQPADWCCFGTTEKLCPAHPVCSSCIFSVLDWETEALETRAAGRRDRYFRTSSPFSKPLDALVDLRQKPSTANQ